MPWPSALRPWRPKPPLPGDAIMKRAAPTSIKQPQKPSPPPIFASIDVGATGIRMDIAELRGPGRVRVLESLHRPTSLGRDTFTTGRIEPATIEACAEVLKGFRAKLDECGVPIPAGVRAVATSAVREAENRESFIDRVYIAAGILIEPIEEPEVHRLTYMALHHVLQEEPFLRKGDVLVVEVGGGGTKLLLIQDGYVNCSDTFRLGSLRLRETLDPYHGAGERTREAIDQQISRTIDQIERTLPVRRVPCLVAVTGDMPAKILEVCDPRAGPSRARVTRMDMRRFARAEKLILMPDDELVRQYRISYEEAATAGPALLSYVRLARAFHVREIVMANVDLRLGILFNESVRGAWSDRFADQVIYSAVALGRKYAIDQAHARHVADLAVELFRELAPEHKLPARYEILLRVTALLHDIGTFVSSRSHHKHSMYLIANSELFGLTTRETELISLVARYHRRSLPLPTHPEYMALDHESRITVSKLAALLRVADALDRSHSQRIRNVSFARGPGELMIVARDVGDATLEQLALERKGSMFESVFGLKAVLRTTHALGRGPHA